MKLRILVIDDEEAILEILRRYLEERGHEVVTATEPLLCDVYQQHDCSQKTPCADLILIDQRMPGMTGIEFVDLQFKRGCQLHPANKAIIAGNTAEVDMEKAHQLGCRVFLKPLDFKELDVILQQAQDNLASHS